MAFPKPDVGKWGAEAKVEDMLQCSMVTRGCPLLLPEKAGNMAVSHSEDRGGGGGESRYTKLRSLLLTWELEGFLQGMVQSLKTKNKKQKDMRGIGQPSGPIYKPLRMRIDPGL